MAQVKRFLSGKKFRIFAHLNFRIRTSEFCDYTKAILIKHPLREAASVDLVSLGTPNGQ